MTKKQKLRSHVKDGSKSGNHSTNQRLKDKCSNLRENKGISWTSTHTEGGDYWTHQGEAEHRRDEWEGKRTDAWKSRTFKIKQKKSLERRTGKKNRHLGTNTLN